MPSPKPKAVASPIDIATRKIPSEQFTPFLFGDQGLLSTSFDLSKLNIAGNLPTGEQRTAPFNPLQGAFFGNAVQTGFDPTTSGANAFLGNLFGQDPVNNPFVNSIVNRAQGDIVDQFNLQTAPALAARSRFSGSADNTGLQEIGAFSRFSTERALGDVRATAANAFLGNQLQGTSALPGVGALGLQQQQNLLNAGNILQGREQTVRDIDFQNLLSQFDIPAQQQSFLANILNQGGLQNFGTTTQQGFSSQVLQPPNDALGITSAGIGAAGVGLAALALFSSRKFKHAIEPAGRVLDKLTGLEIKKWKYKPGMQLGEDTHIGPMAEDFQKTFGVGDGVTIAAVDMFGVLLKGMQELAAEIRQLRAA